MAISRDTSGTGTAAASTSNTDAITIGATSSLLIVWHVYNTAGGATPVTATWNGVNMTKIISNFSVTTGIYRGDVYIMYSPTSGAHNLVTATSISELQQAYWISYIGTATSGQFDATNIAGPTAGQPGLSSSITVNTAGCWVAALGLNNASVPNASSGVVSTLSIGGTLASILMDSNGAVSTGANSYGFSAPGNGDVALVGVSVALTGAVTKRSLALLGVG